VYNTVVYQSYYVLTGFSATKIEVQVFTGGEVVAVPIIICTRSRLVHS